MALADDAPNPDELTIDQLAARSRVPSRTIREYQSFGLLPAPERRGRVAIYRTTHVRRLDLIGRLQDRGYSLAGIKDLLGAWRDGADLGEVLGLAPDDLVHIDEPGAKVTLDGLTRALPRLVPSRLDELIAVRLIDLCGPDLYCVPSPSLLQISVDMLTAGYRPDQVLSLLGAINMATESIARATSSLLAKPPKSVAPAAMDRLVSRGRGLLAHGVGRLTIYNLGTSLDAESSRPRREGRG